MSQLSRVTGQAIRSVPWTGFQAIVVYLVPWVILPLVIWLWLGLLSPYFGPVREFSEALQRETPAASFSLIILDLICSFALIGYYLRRYKLRWSAVGLRSFNPFLALLCIVLIFVAFGFLLTAAFMLVSWLYPGFDANQPQTTEFDQAPATWSFWALVIIPPIIEEITFRGFIFPAFARRFGLIGGAVISSFMFGFAHLQANVGVYTFVLGLLLCWLYVRFGSIYPGIGLHMLNNYIAQRS